MLTVPDLTPQLLYIEPLHSSDFLSQTVYRDQVIKSPYTSEKWIDNTLIHFYSSDLKTKRKHVKLVHKIHKMQPIVIDEKYHFVLFPLNSSKHQDIFWVNLSQFLEFIQKDGKLLIRFIPGIEVIVDYDFKKALKQYDNTLQILDRTIKHKTVMSNYFKNKEG